LTTTLSRVSTDRRFDLLSLGTFIIVGLPDGMLGTAWPAMRQSFGVPVGGLGLILLVNTIGSVAVAAFVGRLIQRLGVSWSPSTSPPPPCGPCITAGLPHPMSLALPPAAAPVTVRT